MDVDFTLNKREVLQFIVLEYNGVLHGCFGTSRADRTIPCRQAFIVYIYVHVQITCTNIKIPVKYISVFLHRLLVSSVQEKIYAAHPVDVVVFIFCHLQVELASKLILLERKWQ